MGRPHPRRPLVVRVPGPRRRSGRAELVHDPGQARGIPARLRRLRPCPLDSLLADRVERLLENPAIVRNRLKIESTVSNARAVLAVTDEFRSFDAYLWAFVDGKPLQNHWERLADLPGRTPVSDALSKDQKRRGFRFVGSTIMYAFMQATGMVNDHVRSCFRYRELGGR
jgi:DNA-3-methyladenine glycosylase I